MIVNCILLSVRFIRVKHTLGPVQSEHQNIRTLALACVINVSWAIVWTEVVYAVIEPREGQRGL